MCIDNADSAQREIKVIPRAKALKAYRWFDYDYAWGRSALEAVCNVFRFKSGSNRTTDDPAEDPNLGFHALRRLQETRHYEYQGSVIAQVIVWGTVAIERDGDGQVIGYRSTHLEIVKFVYFNEWRTTEERRLIQRRYLRKAA